VIWYPEVQTLDAIPAFHAARRPDAPALIAQGRITTYLELEQAITATARALRAAGVSAGDRVAYLGRESESYYELLFGCAKTGAVLVPVNWRLTAAEVGHILRDSGTALLFVEDAFDSVAKAAGAELPEPPAILALDADGEPGEGFRRWRGGYTEAADAPTHQSFPDGEVVQIYTSGTTGLPKGVVLAHRSFFAVRDSLAGAGLDWIDWQEGDVSLVAVPGFHIGGLWWAVQGLAAGVENVVLPAFSPGSALDAIRTHGVTTTCLVPSMIRMLLAEAGVTRADFATLRKVAYGGSPISTELLAQCAERIGSQLTQLYGLTETGNTAVCLPPEAHVPGSARLLAAGRAYPGFGIKVVGPDGQQLPAGESGEICLRTPGHMIGYWGLPDATGPTSAGARRCTRSSCRPRAER
jgi:fatty-acyl-CoA synthase/long-chain acyl-CoA synthetase